MTKRLKILENSLAKKQTLFDEKLEQHYADVKSANGQPINDKRNGSVTLSRWEKQNDSLRTLKKSIDKTNGAIERENSKIDNVNNYDTPDYLDPFLKTGELIQWRKHPRFFFVKGVKKARILIKEGELYYRYTESLTQQERALFADIAKRLKEARHENKSS